MFLTADELASDLDVTVPLLYFWQDIGKGPEWEEYRGRRIYASEAVAAWKATQVAAVA